MRIQTQAAVALLIAGLLVSSISSAQVRDYRQLNDSLEFIGHVVDVHGRAVPKARIKYVVYYYPEATFSKYGFDKRNLIVETTTKGRFTIRAQGIRLYIDRVTKKGYRFNNNWTIISDTYQATGAEETRTMSRAEPVVFVGTKVK